MRFQPLMKKGKTRQQGKDLVSHEGKDNGKKMRELDCGFLKMQVERLGSLWEKGWYKHIYIIQRKKVDSKGGEETG